MTDNLANVNSWNLALNGGVVTIATHQTILQNVSNETMSSNKKKQEKNGKTIPSDIDDDFKYEEVSLEDEWILSEGEEDLEAMVKAIKHRAEAKARVVPGANSARDINQPQTVDDFLRNFLYQSGMTETLDCFQTEWTEMVQKGLVDAERVGVVPSVYIENQRLDSELKKAKREREEYERAASAAADTVLRVQKARDFHRMQHKRVLQEKHRLIEELRKLKVQCDNYEPVVNRMNDKYQALLKRTMLVTLERDKALAQVNCQSSPGSPGQARSSTSLK